MTSQEQCSNVRNGDIVVGLGQVKVFKENLHHEEVQKLDFFPSFFESSPIGWA